MIIHAAARKPEVFFTHSFAARKLYEQKISIRVRGERVLIPSSVVKAMKYDYPLNTSLLTGEKFVEKSEVIIINDYLDLKRLGMCIVKRSAKKKKTPRQIIEYVVVKDSMMARDFGSIPIDHVLQYSPYDGTVSLQGPNSWGDWVPVRQFRHQSFESDAHDPMQAMDDFCRRISPFSEEVQVRRVSIPEIPVMITSDGGGKVVCIPKFEPTDDQPVIFFSGMKGSGKTMGMHSILDTEVSKAGHSGMVVNDVQNETWSWCLPWTGREAISKKRQIINESTCPLPMVYLTPDTSTVTHSQVVHPEEVGFKISLPSRFVLENINSFFRSREGWVFSQATLQRYKNLIYNNDGSIKAPGILTAKNYSEMEVEINKEKNDDSRNKIASVIKGVMNEKILDVTSQGASVWDVEFDDGRKVTTYPWHACMMAGLVPSIITEDLSTKQFYSDYLSFIIEDVFRKQNDSRFKIEDRPVHLVIDEIHNLKKYYDIIDNVFRQGRKRGISIHYATQNVEEISDAMNINTDYMFFFRSRKKQMDRLSGDFNMLESQKESLKTLKPFECVAATTRYFVLYDSEGNREILENGVVRGRIFPSLSMHSAPMRNARVV